MVGGYGFDWEAGIQGAHERNGSRITRNIPVERDNLARGG